VLKKNPKPSSYSLNNVVALRSKATIGVGVFCLVFSAEVSAQEALQPLSAIDWFKQHVVAPKEEIATDTPLPEQSDAQDIDVSILGPATPDSVGLISSAVSGFAPSIWSASNSENLDALLQEMQAPHVPALSILLTRLMLTEAESPQGPAGQFLQSRVEMLQKLGDVEPAIALLERADPEENPALFALWADLKLLHGEDRELCERLADKPELSPGYDFQVYCHSRNGDWPTAATTLLAAEVLGELEPEMVLLLTRYLDPELFEGVQSDFNPSDQITPLQFRIMEGIGEPWPTESLPLAFAHSDLRGLVGWRAQITAAERLARTGAVSENRLLGIYSANKPSASGGVWDRATDIQALDHAIQDGNTDQMADAITSAWTSFETVGLRHVLANLYGDRLANTDWSSHDVDELVHEVSMLSRTYQGAADRHWPTNHRQAFLDAIAKGSVAGTSFEGAIPEAIRTGFSSLPSLKYTELLKRDADGEALLMAINAVSAGRDSFPSDISDAISVFRVLGLDNTARQFSLQLILGQS
jgi:hypothetical protein